MADDMQPEYDSSFEDARDDVFEHDLNAVDALLSLPDALQPMLMQETEGSEEEVEAEEAAARNGEGMAAPAESPRREANHGAEPQPEMPSVADGPWRNGADEAFSPRRAPRRRARAQLNRLGSKLQQRFKQLWHHDHHHVERQGVFLLGCTMLWGCAFWLGRSPETFYMLYSFVGVVLFAVRFFTYRRKRQHYYLFDFCYMANLLLLANVWIFPRWKLLQQTTFAFNTGPLTWSILAFRNSLVFHDMDKVTSLFMHLVPALVSWSLRWYPPAHWGLGGGYLIASHLGMSQFFNTTGDLSYSNSSSSSSMHCQWPPAAATAAAPASLASRFSKAAVMDVVVHNVVIPMSLYLLWAFLYYLQIFVFSAKRIQQRGYQTLFKWCITQKKGAFHSIAKRVPPSLQPQIYLLLHCVYSLCTLLFAVPCWELYSVHTALLALITCSSIWSGACYYFEVFALRYHASITEAVKHVEKHVEKNESELQAKSTLPSPRKAPAN